MKRILPIAAALVVAGTLAGALLQFSRTESPSGPGKADGPLAELAKNDTAPPSSGGHEDEAAHVHDDTIDMPSERIEAQGIKVSPAGKGVVTQALTVPGTIALDPGRVARVPGRVVGTVTQMRKRLGDMVSQGEVVAVLDSREVADAKSEYLTASVAIELQTTLLERVQALWAKRFAPEQRYLQARESFLEAELRLGLARQKLSALNLDPGLSGKSGEARNHRGFRRLNPAGVSNPLSHLRARDRTQGGVGSLVGSQGDPADLYTIADLSEVWLELAVPIADLDAIAEGQAVVIASQGESVVFVRTASGFEPRDVAVGRSDEKTWRNECQKNSFASPRVASR